MNQPSPQAPASPLPLTGEHVAFTGTLASMTHRQALALVQQLGGRAMGHISRQTTILVVGEEGWPLEEDGSPSLKLVHALRLQHGGQPLRIVQESDWLSFAGLHDHLQELHRHYTPAMLSQMLKIPVNRIRRWHRAGLLHPVKQVFRLPYFDYREVASIQKLAQLLETGVPWRQVREGLQKVAGMLGDERNLAQINLLVDDHTVLYRDDEGWVESLTGQRLFDFDPEVAPRETEAEEPAPKSHRIQEHWTAEDWHGEAQRLLHEDDLSGAVDAIRMALMDLPARAEWHFLLAEILYRQDNLSGALERYHIAIELDNDFLEAWGQLGCLYLQLEAFEAAEHAFQVALGLHADYPEAHLHLAELLHKTGRTAEAVPHWQAYLKEDQRGPWADNARERLRQAGSPHE
ncbi:MAG: tetratricopeptide repeat protein [Planctomycetales bacterium]